ncbi:hypothetical protein ABTW72_19070 [Micromonospora sp. NPDC127501]|uniref:hypothetical protein n=1 Tax=Micromonospora sp. NPDC127501 TaxID=3154872 RepID=UPI003324418B
MVRWHWVVPVVAAAMLTACDTDPDAPVDAALPRGESLGELRQQAREALARYDQAIIDAGGAGAVTPTPPRWNSPPGIAIESATTIGAGTQLAATFTGARGPATESCGADYHAQPVESANAVVVIVIAQYHDTSEVCPMSGYQRSVTFNLAQPLGKRPVLEIRQGQPVPLTLR